MFLVWVFCFTLEWMCGCNEIITVFVSCLAVTMIEKCTDVNSTFPQTALQTLRNILMAQKTWGPCLIKVSHGIMYKLFKGAATVPLVRGTVGLFRWGGGLQANMHMACSPSYQCTKTLTILITNMGWVFGIKMRVITE